MHEIISSDLKINKKLPMRQIMALYQEMKKYEGNIYFINKHKVIEASKLSKLVSFMLTVDEKSVLKVVIEGRKVQKILDKVTKYCQTVSEKQLNKFYINPTDTVQI